MEQKEIAWAEVPHPDYRDIKIRPIVIISNNVYNSKTEDVLACAITSNTKAADYSVYVDSNHLASGKLAFPSRIRADKLFFIKKTRILKSFGVLSNQKFDELIKQIQLLISRK